MKLTWQRLVILLLIIGFSVGFGFAFDAIADRVERSSYPKSPAYASMIAEYAAEFALPEAILWAVVHTESEFVSNAVSQNGDIGLMQISPQKMDQIYKTALHEDAPDSGLLYDPKTNLRAGAAWLSYLYQTYGVWDTVFAAWDIGTDQVDIWLTDTNNCNELGQLSQIPDKETGAFVNRVQKAFDMYTKLYYE